MSEDQEGKIAKYVEVNFRKVREEAFDRARKESGGSLGRLVAPSIASIERVQGIWEGALTTVIDCRVAVEEEARRRFGLRLSSDNGEAIRQELEALINAACGEQGAVSSSLSRPRQVAEERLAAMRLRLVAYTGQRIEQALAEAMMPEPRPTTTVSNVIEVNAPNYGVIASRIDQLSVGVGIDELKAVLKQLLETIENQLPTEQAGEGKEIVDGLVTEAERAPTANRRLVRQAFRKLGELAQAAKNAEAFASLVSRAWGLFESLISSLPR